MYVTIKDLTYLVGMPMRVLCVFRSFLIQRLGCCLVTWWPQVLLIEAAFPCCLVPFFLMHIAVLSHA